MKLGQKIGDMVVKFISKEGYICINERYIQEHQNPKKGRKRKKEMEREKGYDEEALGI